MDSFLKRVSPIKFTMDLLNFCNVLSDCLEGRNELNLIMKGFENWKRGLESIIPSFVMNQIFKFDSKLKNQILIYIQTNRPFLDIPKENIVHLHESISKYVMEQNIVLPSWKISHVFEFDLLRKEMNNFS